ncbi:DNRLRE domain-containing protein [bacterium]|nr:DNRLRE domain-containing protein [bacterium]
MRLDRFCAVLLTIGLLAVLPLRAAVVDTLYCDADVTITGAAPYLMSPGGGHQGYLSVGQSDLREGEGENRAFLRFDLNGIDPASIQSAELHLWKTRSRSDSLRVYAVESDIWDEYETAWLNAPPMGQVLATGLCGQGWSVYDLTGWARSQNNDHLSLGLRTVNPYTQFLGINSREGGAPPRLIVRHEGPARGDPAPTPGFPSSSALEHGVYVHGAGGYRKVASISDAVAEVRPGEEVVLGPGVYYESFTLSGEGTPEQPLKIRGDGNPRPAVDGSLSTAWKNTDRGLIMVTGKNWIIQHLDIRNAHPWGEAESNSGCFYIHQAENTVIRDCGIYFGGDGIFSTDASKELTVENCEVAYNSFPHAGYEHGFYVCNAGTVTVRYSYIHHNGGQNFKTRAEDCVFAYNYVEAPGNYQLDFSEGEKFEDEDAMLIGNTIVTNNRYRSNNQYIVFGENRHGGSLFLYNNTFVNLYPANGDAWIHMWFPDATPVGETTLSAWNNAFYFQAGSASMKFYDSEKSIPVSGGNNWFVQGTSGVPSTVSGSLYGDDPGFTDLAAGDFVPRQNSPLVDAGSAAAPELPGHQNLQRRLDQPRTVIGAAPDIGAYEYDQAAQGGSSLEWDFNPDGRLDLKDVIVFLLKIGTGAQSLSMDVNGDGNVSLSDAVALVRELRRSHASVLAGAGEFEPLGGLD